MNQDEGDVSVSSLRCCLSLTMGETFGLADFFISVSHPLWSSLRCLQHLLTISISPEALTSSSQKPGGSRVPVRTLAGPSAALLRDLRCSGICSSDEDCEDQRGLVLQLLPEILLQFSRLSTSTASSCGLLVHMFHA